MKRRHFLHCAGGMLASLGLSQIEFLAQSHQYAKTLAQPTSRKLALLIGLNDYLGGVPLLRGCLTDIELQHELLVHRYGFNPQDILVLRDREATRSGILDAFESHLVNQARPGDVVVFHYSGHGSRVVDPNPIDGLTQCFDGDRTYGCNGTLVPYDGRDISPASTTAQDIMGRTLFLLMSAIATDHLTVILDSCHSGGGMRGEVRVRAIDGRFSGGAYDASDAELSYQERWLSKLGLSVRDFENRRRQGIAKGVALGSAQANQIAADAPFSGFHAGAFSYLLTRYLWQEPSSQPLRQVFVNLARSTHDIAAQSRISQDPVYAVHAEADQAAPVFHLAPMRPAAEAVVQSVEGDTVTFWLGGVSPQTLSEQGAYRLIDERGQVMGQVQQTQRLGLVGQGRLTQGTAKPGTLMRELVRGIPSDLNLKIALDPSLGSAVEDWRSVLTTEQRYEWVEIGAGADFLIGRMTHTAMEQARLKMGLNHPQLLADFGELGSLGLFTPTLTPVPGSFGGASETTSMAMGRLRPRLKLLLASRLLRALQNNGSSTLKVEMQVSDAGGKSLVITRSRGTMAEPVSTMTDYRREQFRVGSRLLIKLTNNERRNLHVALLVIGSNGDLNVLHPIDWDSADDASLLAPGDSLTVPNENDFEFIVQGPAGHFELMVLASTTSLRNALRGLKAIASTRGLRSGDPLTLEADEPLEVLDTLLKDLDQGTPMTRSTVAIARKSTRAIASDQLAAISTIIQVID